MPQLFLIFRLLAGGEQSFGLLLFRLFFIGIFLNYLYLLFSISLSPKRAALSAVVVSTIPWLLSLSFGFDSYFPFMTLMLAAAYHLYYSDNFSRKDHTVVFVAALSLAACLRPLDLILIFGVPFMLFVFERSNRENGDGRKNVFVLLYLGIVTALSCMVTVDLKMEYPNSLLVLLVLILFQALPILFRSFLQLPRNSTVAFCICAIKASTWWIPFSETFFLWAKTASVGRITNDFVRPPGMNLFEFFAFHYNVMGSIGFYFLFSLSIIQFVKDWRKGDRNRSLFIFPYLIFVPLSLSVSSRP